MNIFRTLMAVLAFFLFTAFLTAPQSYAVIEPDSVVALWLLDENDDNIAIDSSENGHHDGELRGNPEWDEGKFGDALKFNGGGAFVECGNDPAYNLDTFTVTFWSRFPTDQGWNHMVSRGSHVASGSPGSVNWGVMMRSAEARFLYEIYQDVSWTGISAPEVPTDEWQHLAATYDGDRMEFFLNGVSLGSSAGVKIKLDETRSFRIGGIATAGVTPGNFFNGSIDEVAYFNTALNLEDIQDIMNLGLVETLNINPVAPGGKSATTWAEIKK